MMFLPLNIQHITNSKKKKKGQNKPDKKHCKSATDSCIDVKGRLSHLRSNAEMTQVLGRSVSESDVKNAKLHPHFYTATVQNSNKPENLHRIMYGKSFAPSQSRCPVHSHSNFIELKSFYRAEVASKQYMSPDTQNLQNHQIESIPLLETDRQPLTLREKFNARKARYAKGVDKN